MKDIKKKKRGRPIGSKSANPLSTQLPVVRVTPEQLAVYKAAAKKENKTFSAWVRDSLDGLSLVNNEHKVD